MNWDEPQHDPLDELLQRADWPKVSPEQLDRLQRGWRRTVRRRKALRAISAAAVFVIPIIGTIGLLTVQQNRQPIEKQLAEHPMKDAQDAPNIAPDSEALVSDIEPHTPDQSETVTQIVRKPNAYERALALVHRRQIAAARVAAKQMLTPAAQGDPIDAAIQRLIDQPELDAGVVARELATMINDCEPRLRRWLQNHAAAAEQNGTAENFVVRREAALRLLGIVATQESAALLLATLQNENCPTEVIQAVARLSTTEQLAARARWEPSTKRQKLWLVALLERGTAPDVVGFLELVNDPSTSGAALAAVDGVNDPPLDELFAAMQNSRVRIREAAARVLGTLSSPTVSKRLIEMAMNAAPRREALIGLMTSSDPVARQFVAYARHDWTLAASVRAIGNRFSLVQSVN